MLNRILFLTMLTLTLSLFTACDDDDDTSPDTTGSFDLNITGLDDLGADYVYEGWLIVNGSAVSTGTFTVNADGETSSSSFTAEASDIDSATTFVLTIEPAQDSDPEPSAVHILAGDFSNGTADLTIGHSSALNDSFESSAGVYILATPTDGSDADENSGIWFLDLTSGTPSLGLTLPELPAAWVYEGWAVLDGIPVSTGTFSSGSGVDAADTFSGTTAGPPYPGEDFLNNAPAGLSFPTDISGGSAVISIEPVPDNSSAPFTLKPLLGMIPENSVDHITYNLEQNLAFPTGQAIK